MLILAPEMRSNAKKTFDTLFVGDKSECGAHGVRYEEESVPCGVRGLSDFVGEWLAGGPRRVGLAIQNLPGL